MLPALNAVLNALAGVLLVLGYVMIRQKRRLAHRRCMLGAFGVSVVFLITYAIHHAQVGSVPFRGQGLARAIYFAVLVPHIVLAAAIVPMALVTLRRGLKGRLESHRRIARVTLPVWLYVSVSGVAVYAMLYH